MQGSLDFRVSTESWGSPSVWIPTCLSRAWLVLKATVLLCWTASGSRLQEMAFCHRVLGDGFRRVTDVEPQNEKDISKLRRHL